jgi:serine/threonine protein phosphatase PrpC
VITAEPDIKSFRLNSEYEFVLLASDGVFDKMTNREVLQSAWNSVAESQAPNIHQQCGKAVDAVLKASLLRRSLDNVTCVIVAFPKFKEKVKSVLVS